MSEINDNVKTQVAGLKWVFEMELLDEKNPTPINVLKLNVLMVSPKIKEVEFLIFREGKQILVLLDLSWLGRKFYKKQIFTEVNEVLTQMLPTFRFRVTADPKIMQMAVDKVQKLLGDMNEIRNRPDDVDDISDGNDSPKQPVIQGTVPANPPDTKEPSTTDQIPEVRAGSIPGDSTERS